MGALAPVGGSGCLGLGGLGFEGPTSWFFEKFLGAGSRLGLRSLFGGEKDEPFAIERMEASSEGFLAIAAEAKAVGVPTDELGVFEVGKDAAAVVFESVGDNFPRWCRGYPADCVAPAVGVHAKGGFDGFGFRVG